MSAGDYILRSLPYLDEKWIRADLNAALRSAEHISILWNHLLKYGELCLVTNSSSDNSTVAINQSGNVSFVNSSGRHYCGAEKLTCSCCSGYCRPDANCNCAGCKKLDDNENPGTKKLHSTTTKPSTPPNSGFHLVSDKFLDLWLWGPLPSNDARNGLKKSLLVEQCDISLQAASHSLSAVHLKQRLFVYQRYLIAVHRFKSPILKRPILSNDLVPVPKTSLSPQNNISMPKETERATFGLARVGTRAALNFSFAFLTRAWRSGDDTELCSELLAEALDVLQSLPEASLFDTSQVSPLWIEVLERSIKFLKQVVLDNVMGDHGSVPIIDRHTSLSLLLELAVQKGTLCSTLEAVLLLLTLSEKETDMDDNRTASVGFNTGAPLLKILQRYEIISDNNSMPDNCNAIDQTKTRTTEFSSTASPTESFLRFLNLPKQQMANVDLKQAAVVIMCHLDWLAKPHLPYGMCSSDKKQEKDSQQVYALGWTLFSSDSEFLKSDTDIGVIYEELNTSGQHFAEIKLDMGEVLLKQIVFSNGKVYLLSESGDLFVSSSNFSLDDKKLDRFTDFPDGVKIEKLASHYDGKHMLALDSQHQVYSWGFGENGRLGHNNTLHEDKPKLIEPFAGKCITNIYCGSSYSAAVCDKGKLYTWGRGIYGCLGHEASGDKYVPVLVQALAHLTIVDVALGSGDAHSLCVTNDGIVYAWGDGDYGKLGNGKCSGSEIPLKIDGLESIVRVMSGEQFSIALKSDGTVFSWGKINGGRLGHGDNLNTLTGNGNILNTNYLATPKLINSLKGKHVIDIAVGCTHCLALTTSGELYGWGRNDFQQICPKSVCKKTIISTPILVKSRPAQISGLACGTAQSMFWCHPTVLSLPPRIPFVMDLNEATFKYIDTLLGIVCDSSMINIELHHPPNQESECIAVACLNLLRLQLHSLITNSISPSSLGLADGSRLLTSLKSRILSLASGSTVLKTIQEAAQWTLQIGWSVLFPTSNERAQTLTSLLPTETTTLTSGHRFMTDLLVRSLMAEDGLELSLRQAILSDGVESATQIEEFNLPLLHLIKQLLRNNSVSTQTRLNQLMIGKYPKTDNDGFNRTAERPSASINLLHRFQRLLISYIHQTNIDHVFGAVKLMEQYIHQVVSLCVATLTKAKEVASICCHRLIDILKNDISDTLFYELIIGLALLQHDKPATFSTFDWAETFLPLLQILDDINRILGETETQDIDCMGWPGIICRNSAQKTTPLNEEVSTIRQSDLDNHLLGNDRWIILRGYVFDIKNYCSDNQQTNDLLNHSIGKDISLEMTNPLHKPSLDYIFQHLKVGKLADSYDEEEVSSEISDFPTYFESQQALAYLLGIRARLLEQGSELQPAEIQCKNLLKSAIVSGGLQKLQPINPFDEEKGEARRSVASTAGNTPTEGSDYRINAEIPNPTGWAQTMINQRVEFLLSGLGDGRLTEPLVSTWMTLVERYCKEKNVIWHQDFPQEHPISELERLLTAVFIRHQHLGPLVLAVLDRELSCAQNNCDIGDISNDLPEPIMDILRLVHQTKWQLIKTRQQLNRSYKEVCASMLDKCRFLLYEVRPAISIEQSAFRRLNILYKPSRFRSLVHRIIYEIRKSKKITAHPKADDILNGSIRSKTPIISKELTTGDQFISIICDDNLGDFRKGTNIDKLNILPTSKDQIFDNNNVQTKVYGDANIKAFKNNVTGTENASYLSLNNTARNEKTQIWTLNDKLFINDVIAKMSDKHMRSLNDGYNYREMMSLIVDFVLQDSCDVETLRRAMYCQIQRYQQRKNGIEMFTKFLETNQLLQSVKYIFFSGYLGLFINQPNYNSFESLMSNLNMITAYQKTDLILIHSKILEWAIQELQKFVNQEHIFSQKRQYTGKDNTNIGTYVFLKKLPRARFLLNVFGILSKDLDPNGLSLLINSGLLGTVLGLVRQTGFEIITQQFGNYIPVAYEDTSVKRKPVKTMLTGQELAKLMKIGTKVIRGADWKWGDQDGPAPSEGHIISEVGDDGWVRVEWNHGATNSYRMGKEGQYDLRLADNASSIVSPESESEEDISLIEVKLNGHSHPTKLLKSLSTRLLKIVSISVGQYGDLMQSSTIQAIGSLFRAMIMSKEKCLSIGFDQSCAMGFLRSMCISKKLILFLSNPTWINCFFNIIDSPITCPRDVYKKIQCLRLLQVVLINREDKKSWHPSDVVDKLFATLGRIVMHTSNDVSANEHSFDRKSRVLLSASFSGTIAEELISLIRRLHTSTIWNKQINSYIAQELCVAAEIFLENGNLVPESKICGILSVLSVVGGYDPRLRIGQTVLLENVRGTIVSFTERNKVILNMHDSPAETKKITDQLAREFADVFPFCMTRLPLNEMLLNAWTVLLYGTGNWICNFPNNIDITLLRLQQVQLAALNATMVLNRHQNYLRKILRQRSPGLSRCSSTESINDRDNCNVESIAVKQPTPSMKNSLNQKLPDLPKTGYTDEKELDSNNISEIPKNELLIYSLLTRATQPNPLKACYSYEELTLAAINLTQQLSKLFNFKMNTPGALALIQISPPAQPTIIHGVPIYNDGIFDECLTPSSDGSNLACWNGAPPSTTNDQNQTVSKLNRKPPTFELEHQIVEMGFHIQTVRNAIRYLMADLNVQPSVEQIIQHILNSSNNGISETCDLINDSDSEISEPVVGQSNTAITGVERANSPIPNTDLKKQIDSPNQPHWFLTRDHFSSDDEYAIHIRSLVAPGMSVRCCQDFEEINEGDIGTVCKVDTEGLHDLNVQVDWQLHGGKYWMCFVHIELTCLINDQTINDKSTTYTTPMSSTSVQQRITIGSHVRIKSSVAIPRYKWGSVPRSSIGVVTAINDSDVTVNFPQQFNWTGQLSEMELVCQGNPEAHHDLSIGRSPYDVHGNLQLVEDWSRCIRSLTVSSNETLARNLLDKSNNYWQSSGSISQGRHWIRMEMHDNILIHQLSIMVNPSDCSHMPSLIVVRVGDSVESLKDYSWVSLKPASTQVQLLNDIRMFYKYIEIVIKQCKNNGIHCRVHYVSITGRRKENDLDLMLNNAGFLASDRDPFNEPTFSTSYTFPDDQPSDLYNCKVLVWGLNDKEQLGGLKGSKVKLPTYSSTLSQLRPVHIAGGSKSLFIVSQDGKVYSCGEGTNGRLGLGHTYNVSIPRKLPVLSQYVVKKVAVHSGGKHAMALTLDGKVFSWGEGEDGKLGHGNRMTIDKPKQIETLKSKRIRDIACGSSHSAAISSSGELYTWGLGEYGRLGHGDNSTQLKPKLVSSLLNHRIVQVACGSRDAQTLALTEDGLIFSWGDGDFGKLGRGGSEGCSVPHQVERLNNVGIIQIDCGAQFSLALTKSGEVWTWGKGDYYRLGHGSDTHIRKPTAIQGLRGKKVIHVAVGALHCLAVTETGQVFAWGDNDHGQQGSGNTTVNKKPVAVIGLDNVFVNRVACGSSHSIAWRLPRCPAEEDKKEPVPFCTSKDPLGGNSLGIYDSELISKSLSFSSTKTRPSLSEVVLSLETYGARQIALNKILNAISIMQARKCLITTLTNHYELSDSSVQKEESSEDLFTDGHIMKVNTVSAESDSSYQAQEQTIVHGGGEGPTDLKQLNDTRDTSTPDSDIPLSVVPSVAGPVNVLQSLTGSMSMSCSVSSLNAGQQLRQSKMSASAMSIMAATITHQDEVINEDEIHGLDEFTLLIGESEAKYLIDLLKLSVAGRTGQKYSSTIIAKTLINLGVHSSNIGSLIIETCITELEDLCTSRHFLGKISKPIVQETSHPYIDDITLVGHVKIPGAESLRLEFDSRCSTEKQNDPLIIMHGSGRVIATRSGRDTAKWAPHIIIEGDEIRWKFTSDSSVNGWGWRFWVHGNMPPFYIQENGSDLAILSHPSIELVMVLLDSKLKLPDTNILLRLTSALATCSLLGTLSTAQRIWAIKNLHRLMMLNIAPKPLDSAMNDIFTPLMPALLQQYEFEETHVRNGIHLMHSDFFKSLAELACDMQLDFTLPSSDMHKWTWFKRYCAAVRVSKSFINRTELPRQFCLDVRKKIDDMKPPSPNAFTMNSSTTISSIIMSSSSNINFNTATAQLPLQHGTVTAKNSSELCKNSISLGANFADMTAKETEQFLHEDHTIFKAQHDRQLLQWLNRRPDDWALSWGGASTIYGWGHNHRGQLGGLEGGRIKVPTPCESLSLLRPIQLAGGEQTLYAITPDGKLFSTGYGAGGRLGIGGTDSVSSPMLVESLQHVFIKKVAVNSGGKHCLAITADGEVYSWGEGEDGKLGHDNRINYDRPKLIDALSGIGIIDIACGSAHSACITTSGHVLTWGKGRYGRLGHGDSEDQSRPKLVEGLLGVRAVDIACGSGDAQTLCITDDDNVWSWGDGDYGKLGRGGSEGCKVPMKIESLSGLGVIKVECGSQFSVALTRSGAVYTWGKGDYHRLGHGTVEHVRRPKKVAALQGKKIISIATGSLHCVACSDAGEVFTWGDNDEGQLGDGTVSAIQKPRLVTALHGKHIIKVTCGSAHTLALSTTQMTDGARMLPNPPLEYDFVKDIPPDTLHSRLVLLHHFSQLICPCLPMLPISGEFSLSALKDCLVYICKEASFRKVIQSTMVRDKQHGPVIELNRIQVKRSRNRSNCGLAGVDGMKSVFGQMVQKLPLLTQEALYLPHRVWKVKFVGESVDDCGGGFSESIAEMCDELQNGSVPLLIQTPNGRGEAGANRDCFLLDPTLTSILQMNMFRFLGVLMGIAVRTGSPLSLNLAEPVWRQLTGQELRPSDLTEVDRDYVASLLCIRDMDNDPKLFETLDLPFSTPSAKGHDVSLSTRYTHITSSNRHEYVRLALNYRLHEFDEQVKAVRDGMSKVIPVPLLSLFSAGQLQAMVCGSPEIPLSLLKSVATYKGVDQNSPLIRWFWEVMEEFSNQERSLFLRFVWGRTRLPRTLADFRGRDFVLQVLDKYNPPDQFLPESYTCFFLLKMPRYSCKIILMEKLKYAIYFCKSIDTDEYARVAMVEPTEATATENNSDIETEVSEEM